MVDDRLDRDGAEIPLWPDVKLDILRGYAAPYSDVLSKRPGVHHVYIEGFVGSRARLGKPSRQLEPGNPLNALAVRPPFKEFFLIDADGARAEDLRRFAADRADVHVLEGDLNRLLLEEVLPRVREEDHCRGLCVLHPLGWNLDWAVLDTLAGMQSVEIFFHFPMSSLVRVVGSVGQPRRQGDGDDSARLQRIDRFWGDDGWRAIALPAAKQVQSSEHVPVRGEAIVEAFRKRLIDKAGFTFVPKPLPLADAHGEIADYLFFASHSVLGGGLVEHLFETRAQRAETS